MRTFIICTLLIGIFGVSTPAQAQENYVAIENFDEVVIGQHIEVIFIESDTVGVSYEFYDVDPDELIIRQKGDRLEVYLAHARNLEKQRKIHRGEADFTVDWYGDGMVRAKVYYSDLSKVILKGEEDIYFADPIVAETFKLKAYGEMDIAFASIQAEKFKAKFYGDNDLDFERGAIGMQKYKLFGENSIDADQVSGAYVKATNYGENSLDSNSEVIHFTVFGEMAMSCSRGTDLRKGIVLGEYSVNRW
jgi:hypothetical protein